VSHGFAAWIGRRKEIAWWRPAFAGSTDYLLAKTGLTCRTELTSGSNRIPALDKSASDLFEKEAQAHPLEPPLC
jgi:hypothetical protein